MTEAVVRRHLEAVESGDVLAMAADYAANAVLERPDRSFAGSAAIAEYFRSVPSRLGSGTVIFGELQAEADSIAVRWRIIGGRSDGRSGRDVFYVRDNRIVLQRVHLDDADF